MRWTLALAGLALASPSGARAPAATLTAKLAEAIVQGCRAHASAKGQGHAIAVVDSGGHLVAALRMEGNRSGIMDFALEKARAVAARGFATAQIEETAKGTPGFARAPGVVTVAGEVPVFAADGRTMIGAAGASGRGSRRRRGRCGGGDQGGRSDVQRRR